MAQLKAAGVDLTDPSTFQSQRTLVCGQLAVTDGKDLASFKSCSPKIAQIFIDAKKNCENPIDNSKQPGDVDCKKAANALVRF